MRRFGKWLVVAALIFSVGGHWAFLQTVAWVSMAVTYSQEDSVSEALVKTFDGKHPCKICCLVRDGKKSEKKSEAKIDLKKLECFSVEDVSFYFPRLNQVAYSSVSFFESTAPSPPLRPPIFVA